MFNSPTRHGFSVAPRPMFNLTQDKMAAPNNAYYVLTQAHAGLPNSVLFNDAFAAKDTDDLTEGATNLYYTDARVGTYGDAAYLKLDGSNANSNIDIGAYNFTTTGKGRFDGGIGIGTTPVPRKINIYGSTHLSVGFEIDNAGSGDDIIRFNLNEVQKFMLGVDNSDDDKFKISVGGTLGTNDALVIDSSGAITGGTYNTLSILPVGWHIHLSGDGTYWEGLNIAIPQEAGKHFYYGYGGTESHYFGESGELIIDSDGNLITSGDASVTGTGTFANINTGAITSTDLLQITSGWDDHIKLVRAGASTLHLTTSTAAPAAAVIFAGNDYTKGIYLYSSGNVDINKDLNVTGRISTGTATITASADDTDVSGINILFINPAATVVIGGFTGGVVGQVLFISALANGQDITLEHNERVSDQDVFLHTGGDETLSHEFGGWTLCCDGSNWYDTEHSKHV